MKRLSIASLFVLIILGTTVSAQTPRSSESYGRTLNAGLGIGYYGYIGHSVPVIHADVEFDVANNFTLAPFITVISYNDYYYWGNHDYPHRNYRYRHTIIPIGVKGTYYFDDIVGASSKWDFYLAASLGVAIHKTVWENGYYGETRINHGTTGLYLDGHIGTEYHLTNKAGLFLDLSTGISTAGVAIHF